jgi:hypothetical protein
MSEAGPPMVKSLDGVYRGSNLPKIEGDEFTTYETLFPEMMIHNDT